METKIKKSRKELVLRNYVVRHNGYEKKYFENEEAAINELKRINTRDPLGCNYIRVEYTYYERLEIEEEPF